MSDPLLLKPGALVGPYKIVGLIGKGGMGAVYEAYEERLSRKVAIKFIAKELAQDKEMVKRFETESKALARIEHQHTVSVYNIGKHEGVPYIAMEFIEGQSLFEIIKSKSLTIEDSIPMFMQMLAGVKALHDHDIIHRDLKPQNIIYQKNKMIKIVDFGIAKISEKEDIEITRVGTVMGSVNYMSPEVAMGRRANEQSDIRSLGVIFYEMLIGKSPYKSKQYTALLQEVVNTDIRFPIQAYSKVPHNLRKIILKMCERRRNKRYKNAQDVIKDLQIFLTQDTRDKTGSASGMSDRALDDSSIVGRRQQGIKMIASLVILLGAGLFAYNQYQKSKVENSIDKKAEEQRQQQKVLATPRIVFPAYGFEIEEQTEGRGATLSFGWETDTAAPAYQVQVGLDEGFRKVLVDKTVKENTLKGISLFPGEYYWRVKSVDKTLTAGNWSSSGFVKVLAKEVTIQKEASVPAPAPPQVVAPPPAPAPAPLPRPIPAAQPERKYVPPAPRPVPKQRPKKQTAKLITPILQNPKELFTLDFDGEITSRNVASLQAKPFSYPNLRWSSVDSGGFEIDISSDSRFRNILFNKRNLRETAFYWKGAKPGKYYWRVRTKKGSRWTEYSAPGQFYVLVPAPKIQLVNVDPGGGRGIKASITWTPSPMVAGYRLLVSTDPNFRKIIYNKKLRGTTDNVTIQYGKNYFAKVAAVDSSGRKASKFSIIENFRMEREVASVGPSILGPDIGKEYVSKGNNKNFLLFKWTEVPSATKYRIQFSLDPTFADPLYERELFITKYILKRDLPEGTVYWRVQAETKGVKTKWSRPHSIIFIKNN